MKIQIGFLKKNDLLGRIVKFASHGSFSHTFFLIDGCIVADTDFTRNFGFRLLPWKREEFDLIDLHFKELQLIDLMEFIQQSNSKKYDNLENIRWLINKKSNHNNKLNCCESVIDGLIYCGFLRDLYKELNLSPTQLYELLTRRSV